MSSKKPHLAVNGTCPCCGEVLLEPLIPTVEAAKAIGVRPHSLDNWASKRIGPDFVKAGRFRLYSGSALRAFIEARTTKCHAA